MDASEVEVGRRLREAIAALGRHRTQALPQELQAELERYASCGGKRERAAGRLPRA